ncbi:FecR domain-containing protein [Chitinophaga sancti]|uniref:FecR family protein n=1 Tax=Chitinophaga sancti TaxID=1004 RepID=UPI002A759F5A|nr:FecR domain-containing protein [Chitinophaga sancti]WPQ64543.1 FecR domain-containing protein [Chitinophaga sancti]
MSEQATKEEVEELTDLLRLPENEEKARQLIEHAHLTVPEMELPMSTIASITTAIFQAEEKQQLLVVKKSNLRWIRHAAAIILLLAVGGGYVWRSFYKSKQAVLTQQVDDIMPGGDKAILTLADGSTIALDSMGNQQIAKQGGTSILKVAGGTLAYNPEGNSNEVLYNKISTPRGGQFQITLPDGSQVWLNALSSLRFPTAFNSDNRTVELTGEAYFDVQQNVAKPFIVKVADMKIEVLGTSFNVMAYPDETSVQTTLMTGAVKVSATGQTRLLQPGQQTQLQKDGKLDVISTTDTESVIAWKNGYFKFNQADLPDVMRQLARWYDIDVNFEGPIPDFRFVGELKKGASLSTNLKILSYSQVNFKIERNTLTITP